MNVPEEDRICGNCAHRDYANEIIAPVKKPYGVIYENLVPCLISAVEPEAGKPGDAVVYFTERGHCRYHQDAWAASDEFLEQENEAVAYQQTERETARWLAAQC